MTIRLLLLAGLLAVLSFSEVLTAAELSTTISREDLDPAAFSEWVEGKTSPITAERLKDGPAGVVLTRNGQVDWQGIMFGDSKKPGVRHLRIGFTKAMSVGTVVACAGGLSVLKPGAIYPGDVGDDSQWITAQRQTRTGLSSEADVMDYATWILPPGITTQALRFTHTAVSSDQ
ncbi:MAG TPA: hypothetical protein VHX44_09720, partial [Planctomycetota bacterium]|nr:hypothetical protein [Planctomycetota bacterium]